MHTIRTQSLNVLAIMLACSPLVAAQPEDGAQTPAESRSETDAPPIRTGTGEREITLTLTPHGSYSADRDFDSGVGDISSSKFGAGLELAIPLDERGSLTLSADFSSINYDASVAPGAVGMTNAATIYDEFDAVSDLSFGAMYTRILDEGQAVFAGGSIGFASEGGADFGDSLVWGAFGGMSFRVSDTLRIGAGVGVFSRLEESVRVVPLPQITLKIDERWTLKSEGPGLKLDHKWNDDLHFGVAARFEGNDFRIDSDNSIVPEGAVSESGIPITGYIDLASAGGNANISLFAEVGVIVAGETEISDAAGNTVVEDDIDPGVYAGLTLRIRF